jgi:hypothetical protein
MNNKYSIFHLEGGLGKHILATAVAKCIKNNHPDRELIVVCAYPEVFINLDYVSRVYRIGTTPYFYQDYVLNRDSLLFKHEPYFTTDHIHKKKHLIENWCNLYDLNYNGEYPELIFNVRQKQFGLRKWSRSKPIMVLQSNGGPLKEGKYPYSWSRDMPPYIVEGLINHYKNDYHIFHICNDKAITYDGAEVVKEPMLNMELLSILLVSSKRILIDSCLQHASAALGLKSTVLWVGTDPKVFGYELHDNIKCKDLGDFKLPDSYLFNFSFNGELYECPSIDGDLFDLDRIIDSIDHNG